MEISCIILSDNAQEVLKVFIEDLEYFRFTAQASSLQDLIDTPDELVNTVLFCDLDFLPDCFEDIKSLTEKNKTLRVVTFTKTQTVDLTVKSLRYGAYGILSCPFIKSEFLSITQKICDELLLNKTEKSKCRVITIFSNKGGIGKTSVASNLALELAKTTKEEVALIDLNFQSGDITTFWDLKPSFDISYIINNIKTITSNFLINTLEKYHSTGLYILADHSYFKGADDISAGQIRELFKLLKDTFSYVVVDTSAGFDDKTMTAVDNSDLTFLVTVANLPALRKCQRCLDLFTALGKPKEDLQIIVNRYMENDEICLEDIEKLLGQKIFAKIPNNYFTMISAINKGVPVCDINKDSNVARAYNELALKTADYIYKKEIAEIQV